MKKEKKKQKQKKDLKVNKLVTKNNNNKQTKLKLTNRRLRGSRKSVAQERPGRNTSLHRQSHEEKKSNEENKDYFDKINHKYKDNLNFKPTLNITKVINEGRYIKLVDLFEVYTSYKAEREHMTETVSLYLQHLLQWIFLFQVIWSVLSLR